MSEFVQLRNAIRVQFDKMASAGNIYFSAITKNDNWDKYLGSFPKGSNPEFRENTQHDCNCCKSFVRNMGRALTVIDGKLVSIWDVTVQDPNYQAVADSLAQMNKEAGIGGIYLNDTPEVGRDHNFEDLENGDQIKWDHFHQVLPAHLVDPDDATSRKGAVAEYRKVLKRSIDEIGREAVEITLDLLDQGAVPRGDEYKSTVNLIAQLQREYDALETKEEKHTYLWEKAVALNGRKLRNAAIGTLLVDLTEGRDIESAIDMFGRDVVGDSYMRTTGIVTKKQRKAAQDKARELGVEPSFVRRHAVTSDVSVNDVVYADGSVKPFMESSIFDAVPVEKTAIVPNMENMQDMDIETFIEKVMPKADSIELLLENRHNVNLMTLVAPVHGSAPGILKWGNNYSWAYNNDFADAMKERVKAAGGKTDVDFRYSIEWNGDTKNLDDLDAHCVEPNGFEIYYSNKGRVSQNGGMLDVDVQNPDGVAVENITYENRRHMAKGIYRFYIKNFDHRGGRGWKAEIEFDGKLFSYASDAPLRNKEKILLAEVHFDGENFEITGGMEHTNVAKTVWNIDTQNFHRVNMVMRSPNFWGDNAVGNRHLFFILDECKNPDPVRGFYNEFLRSDLLEHRKTFEALGAATKAPYSDEQLSGVGFSSTRRNNVVLRVKGSFSRVINVKF